MTEASSAGPARQEEPPKFDRLGFDRPHSARMYDYFLGGKTHYTIDREAAEKIASGFPGVFVAARHNRDFMHRVTRYLARVHGLRQWLDIGTGIPTEPNLHQVAQSVAPEARVVYVDNDPLVLTYARALLDSGPEGVTAYIEADARDPQGILDKLRKAEILDFGCPTVLSLNALLHFLPDESEVEALLATLLGALPSGSALAMTHAASDFSQGISNASEHYTKAGITTRPRSRERVLELFAGLDLIDPGLVSPSEWHPEESGGAVPLPGAASEQETTIWAGVGIKP